jgi:hypothetical protein
MHWTKPLLYLLTSQLNCEKHRFFTEETITKTVDPGREVLCRKSDHEIAESAWKLIEEVEELVE